MKINSADLRKRVEQIKNTFKEWYQPIDFGNGIVIHVTVPKEIERPELLHDNHRGMAKWNYIIKKNLPDLKNKRILDLGCSCGLFSIEMAKMGAKSVIGIDKDSKGGYHSHNNYIKEDTVKQARSVKKLIEFASGKMYDNVSFFSGDILSLEKMNLGRFDFVLALNILYHALDEMSNVLNQLYCMTNKVLLQCNNAHGRRLGLYSNLQHHIKIIAQSKFKILKIDEADKGYKMPIILIGK